MSNAQWLEYVDSKVVVKRQKKEDGI